MVLHFWSYPMKSDLSRLILRYGSPLRAEQQTDFWDSELPSSGVRVGRRSRSFIVKVRNRRRITPGAYPTVSLHGARKKALALKADNSPGQRASLSPRLAPMGRAE
jgi:hypothetical protein